jgi:hypothetical protein
VRNFAILLLASKAFAWEPSPAFLEKLALIESDGVCTAIGDRGASLGRYQIQRSAWLDACSRNGYNIPYTKDNAFNYPIATQVVKWHLEWIAQSLESRGRKPNDILVYMVYNKGLNGARRLGFNTQIDDPAMNRARQHLCPCK